MNGLAEAARSAMASLRPELARAWSDRIENELRPWSAGIPVVRLRAMAERRRELQTYQIRSGKLWRIPRRTAPEFSWIERARDEYERCILNLMTRAVGRPWPDVDWVMNFGDHPLRGAPVFSTWVRAGDHNPRWPSSAHWPGMGANEVDGSTVRAHRVFTAEALQRSWSERRAIVGWRGTGTGMYDHHFRWSRWMRMLGWPVGKGRARLDLCRIVQPNPELFDVAITGWQQVSADRGQWLASQFPTSPWVEQDWFLGQRFILNVDGNVSTWSFLTMLGTGSVVLRQSSPYEDFCGHTLKAGTHFVGVARNLGDLVSVARACLSDDAGMQRIAAQARAWSARWLSADSVDAYMLGLMAAYADLCPRGGDLAEGAERVHREGGE